MIRNYQKNGVDINLTPIYQSISGLKSNIAELESLTTLSSLSSLSDDISSLSDSTQYISEQIELLKLDLVTEVFPVILSNSSAIDSLSSSLLSVNSSLAALQQSCSDITNSLSTLTGGGLLTNSTFNYQAFNTTYTTLYPTMYLTGDFVLDYTKTFNGGRNGVWNLSEIGDKTISNLSLSYFARLTFNNIACMSRNSFYTFNIMSINCYNGIYQNYFSDFESLTLENFGNLIHASNTYLRGNYVNEKFGYGIMDGFYSIDSVHLFKCSNLTAYFRSCSQIEFNNCNISSLNFSDIYGRIVFKNCSLPTSTKIIGRFYTNQAISSNYTCTLVFENCRVVNSLESNKSVFSNMFMTYHSGPYLVFSVR